MSPRRRGGFTLVEVSLGMAIGLVLTLVVLEVFMSARRGVQQVQTSLEANEATLDTFRKLTKDIRSAKEIRIPGMAPESAAPPEFSWGGADDGTHVLEVISTQLIVINDRLTPVGKRIRWYLDEPQEVAGGDGAKRYSLMRLETEYTDPDAGAAPPPANPPAGSGEPVKVSDGITELVFFRREQNSTTPEPDAGPENLQVVLKAARLAKKAGGGMRLGYTSELRTTVHQRGSGDATP